MTDGPDRVEQLRAYAERQREIAAQAEKDDDERLRSEALRSAARAERYANDS